MDVTSRVHGAEAARVAAEVSGLLFGRTDASSLSAGALAALAAEVPFAQVRAPADGSVDTLELFVAANLAPSKGAARRLLEQGGLTVNGRRLGAEDRSISTNALLPGGHLLLRKGAREYCLVRVAT
jgi:tyrosyl-tRNA synthetase